MNNDQYDQSKLNRIIRQRMEREVRNKKLFADQLRRRTRLAGLGLVAGVTAIYLYSMYAVRSEDLFADYEPKEVKMVK